MILIFWCFGIILVQFEQQVCQSWNNVSMHLFIGVNFEVFIEVCKSGNTDYIVVLVCLLSQSVGLCLTFTSLFYSLFVLIHQLHNLCFLYMLLLITAIFFQVVDDFQTVQWRNVFIHFYLDIVKGRVKKSEIFFWVWTAPLEVEKSHFSETRPSLEMKIPKSDKKVLGPELFGLLNCNMQNVCRDTWNVGRNLQKSTNFWVKLYL